MAPVPGLKAIEPLEEAYSTFAENAVIKAEYYIAFVDALVLADDSGLVVDALNGAPGIYSARYAGEGATEAANGTGVVEAMHPAGDRADRFVRAIAIATGRHSLESFEDAGESQLLGEASAAQVEGKPPEQGDGKNDPLDSRPNLKLSPLCADVTSMAKRGKSISEELADIGRGIGRVVFSFYVPLVALLVLLHYPYDTGQSIHPMASVNANTNLSGDATADPPRRSAEFYEAVYSGPDKNGLQKRQGLNYEETALAAAAESNVPEYVAYFVDKYGIKDKKVLEVGSGQGSLQDVVNDYTGLDISAAVASKYHKKFVVASATAMPFADNSFDAIWTVWVIEHIPEPESAMREMRRVLKPGGKLFLYLAWNCTSWLADGFSVRPYSDFNWKGKLVKASLLARDSGYFKSTFQLPTRLIRWAQYAWNGQSEPLRFRVLEPNYATYWQRDSDAAIGLDPFEALLWHKAQGDLCLNCGSMISALGNPESAWILEIRK